MSRLQFPGQLNNAFPRTGLNVQRIGGYSTNPHSGRTTQAATLSRMYAVPVFITRPSYIDLMGFETTTAGAATAVARLGLYRTGLTDDMPTALIYDSGTFATTGSTGALEQTGLTIRTQPGLHWMVLVTQTVICTFRAVNNAGGLILTPDTSSPTGSSQGSVGYHVTGVTGALPDPFGTPTGTVQNPPVLWIRYA